MLHKAPFKAELVHGNDGSWWRISDVNDNAVCFSYLKENADEVVAFLNIGYIESVNKDDSTS